MSLLIQMRIDVSLIRHVGLECHRPLLKFYWTHIIDEVLLDTYWTHIMCPVKLRQQCYLRSFTGHILCLASHGVVVGKKTIIISTDRRFETSKGTKCIRDFIMLSKMVDQDFTILNQKC
jgi:hypothetical protein